jgi:tripartite-type tricarboxylate transporter receptor subunit TctC
MEENMNKRLFPIMIVLFGLILTPFMAYAAPPFYEGKVIRIVVGHSAGGGFDTYARLVGRHLGKHLPGNPTVIVENMVGAGSLIAAKYLYSRAKPDGLTIGTLTSQLVMAQIMGREGVDIDTRKFEWIGVPVQDHVVCIFNKSSGITSMEKWFAAKTPVKMGGTAPGDTTADVPRILKAALNLPIQLVEGYKGTAEIRLASESGEIAGSCWQWEAVKGTWTKALESGDVVTVLQATAQPVPDLSKVPLATSYAKTEEARQLIKMGIYEPSSVTRPFFLPPGTPKDQVQVLRKAFQETMKDPALLEEAKKSKLDINPVTGEELESIIKGLFNINPSIVSKLKEIIYPKK